MTESGKVFCVGFHKTGTSSLAKALSHLGYRVTGPFGKNDADIHTTALEKALRLVPDFDAFQDNPWTVLYRDLDRRVPGSRFILTIRDPDRWIDSAVRHFGRESTLMRKWIYGIGWPDGNEQTYLDRYARHNREVTEYFSGRSDLLTMDLEAGDSWDRLCPFLDVEEPNIPFPHVRPNS